MELGPQGAWAGGALASDDGSVGLNLEGARTRERSAGAVVDGGKGNPAQRNSNGKPYLRQNMPVAVTI